MAYIHNVDTCQATIDNDDGTHEHTCTRHDTASTLSHQCQCGHRWYHSMLDSASAYTSDL